MGAKEFNTATTVKEELTPTEAQKSLQHKWLDAGEVYALQIFENPTDKNSNFEIKLVPQSDVEKTLKALNNPNIKILSFAAGMLFSRQYNCVNGLQTFTQGKAIAAINKDANTQIQHMGMNIPTIP